MRFYLIHVVIGGIVLSCFIGPSFSAEYSWPITKPTTITSTIGEYRDDHLHEGIDFSTNFREGKTVRAIADGTVERVFYDPTKYGKTIVLRHRDGKRSWYSHLNKIDETILDHLDTQFELFSDIRPTEPIEVRREETIGLSGQTGSGPPHLHLALQKPSGMFINPMGRFRPALPLEVKPRIGSVQVFPLSGDAMINGKTERIYQHSSANQPLEIWGTIGLDAIVWNEHENSSSRSLPQTILLKHNGEVVRKLTFSQVKQNSQERAMRNTFYENYTNLSPTQFTLELTPRTNARWNGIRLTQAGLRGSFTIIARSHDGTTTKRKIKYKVVKPARSVNWFNQDGLVNDTNVVSVQKKRGDQSNWFRRVTLLNYQRALSQYSPPHYSEVDRNPSFSLETQFGFNRIDITTVIDGRWKGWPELAIQSGDFRNYPTLYHVSPGKFTGWWLPGSAREGWHEIEVSVRGAREQNSRKKRIYLQRLRTGEPSAVASLDGRYTLFSDGRSLNVSSTMRIVPTDEAVAVPDGLELIEKPRKITPEYLQSLSDLSLRVQLPETLNEVADVGLFKYNVISRSWTPLSFERGIDKRSREGSIHGGGIVGLLRDSIKPELELDRLSQAENQLVLTVRENGSGVVRNGVEADGIDYEWYPSQSSIVVNLDSLPDDDETVRISVTDRAGNTSTWKGRISGLQ